MDGIRFAASAAVGGTAFLLRRAPNKSLRPLLSLPSKMSPIIVHFDPPISAASAETNAPLHGLTFVAKDSIDVAGFVAGNGSPYWPKGRAPAQAHAPSVHVALAAGATLIGKAHMDELAFSIAGDNPHYGALDNPAAPGRSVGGSSSGSAVAVAAGLADFALGTDTTGSVRVPSAHCAVFGLRPSHGSLSAIGCCTLAASYDTVGILAKSAAVLAAVGDVLLPPAVPSPRPTEASGPAVLLVEDAIELYQPDNADTACAARRAVECAAKAAAATLAPGGSAIRSLRLGPWLLDAVPSLRPYAPSPTDGLGALLALMREQQMVESEYHAPYAATRSRRDHLRVRSPWRPAMHACNATLDTWLLLSVSRAAVWDALGDWAKPRGAPAAEWPHIGEDVEPRLAMAQETANGDAGVPAAVAAKLRVREEVQAALGQLLGDGSVLCFVPVAAPPPCPGDAQEAGYRMRTFTLQAPAGLGALPQLVVPGGRCTATQMPLPVSFVAARGRDRQLLRLAEHLAVL